MPDPSFDYAQGDVPVPIVPRRVYRKPTYATAEWTFEPNVDVLGVVDGANRVTEITIARAAGRILREGASVFAYEPMVDWAGQYVMIELYDLDGNGLPDYGTVLERWIGIVCSDGRDVLGHGEGGFATDQTMLVRGLEWLLVEAEVTGSAVLTATPAGGTAKVACRTDDVIAFNAPRAGAAAWDRNRSKDPVATEYLGPGVTPSPTRTPPTAGTGLGEAGVYAFDLAGTNTEPWTITQVLTHLVSFYGPALCADGSTFRLDTHEHLLDTSKTALRTALAATPVNGIVAAGGTLFDALSAICSPERGLGWRVGYDNDAAGGTKGPLILIFSIQADDVTVGAVTFPKASERDDLTITGRRDVAWQVRNERDARVGRIVVRGEPICSGFSLSQVDGTLDKGWTTSEETEYATPPGIASGDTAYDQKQQAFRSRSRAWSEYVPPATWDFKAKNGEGSGATLVNPRCDDAGELVETPGSRAVWLRRFQNWFPVEIALPAGAAKPDLPEYRRLLVVGKVGSGSSAYWVDLTNSVDPTVPALSAVGALGDRAGVLIRADPADRLAPTAVTSWAQYPRMPWTALIVTLSMRTETRVSVAQSIAGGDPLRVLTIDVPGAELWLMAPGSVIGVKADRTLDRQASGARIVRDDRDRLRRVLAMATAWYGQERRPVAMQFASIVTRLDGGASTSGLRRLRVGLLVERVIDGVPSHPINTVITERRFDLVRNATAISTGFGYQPRFDRVL